MRVIGLGFSCNNACVFCAQGELRTKPDALEDRDAGVDKAIGEIAPGEIVAFAGGEPTLSERLPAWIRAADERGASAILVQTNGRRLAYAAYARALRDASARLGLDVSLHGSTAPMHDYHTATPGSFQQTARGIRNAQALGIRCSVSVVVTRSNFRHLAEIAVVAKSAGASAIRFAAAEPYGSAARAKDRVIPAWELVKPHLAQAAHEARRLGLGVILGDSDAPSDLGDRFVGLGVVEEVTSAAPESPSDSPSDSSSSSSESPRKRGLPMLGRPAPGRQEVRAQVRQTGDDLRAIFPTLFDATGSDG